MAMPVEVEESWAQVTEWLAVNAPVSYATLRPPAAAPDARLPAELRRLLLVNDGADLDDIYAATFLPDMYFPLSADRITDNSAVHAETLADIGDPEMVGDWWHPQWFAFAEDGLGNTIVIDDRPGPGQGMVWKWSKHDGLTGEPAPSLGGFFADVASAFESGAALAGCRPVAEYGTLRWKRPEEQDFATVPEFRVLQVEPHGAGSIAVTGLGLGTIRPGLLFDSVMQYREDLPEAPDLIECRLRVTEIRVYGHLADEAGQARPARLVLSGELPDGLAAPDVMLVAGGSHGT